VEEDLRTAPLYIISDANAMIKFYYIFQNDKNKDLIINRSFYYDLSTYSQILKQELNLLILTTFGYMIVL
jgi:hypothetical protein